MFKVKCNVVKYLSLMKIGLIWPAAECRTTEVLPFPSISTPVLTRHLRELGHKVTLLDIEISLYRKFPNGFNAPPFNILKNKRKVVDYLNNRLNKAESKVFKKIENIFFNLQPVPKCDLYGISLVFGSMPSIAVVNSAALVANKLKKRFPATPVVIGSRLAQQEYYEIFSQYPCFDYAIWGEGEVPLEYLVRYLRSGKGQLYNTLERNNGNITIHSDGIPSPVVCTSPDYTSYPIKKYTFTVKEVFARYKTPPLIRKYQAGKYDQLILYYKFQSTCRGSCAFCDCSHGPSDRRSVDQVIEELCRLKELGVTGVNFINTNFNDTYKFADELCDKMIKYKLDLQWSDCANFRFLDEKLLSKMQRSGAVKLIFGLETGSPRLLKYIKKNTTIEQAEKCLRYAHKLGIWNHLELIPGLPRETDKDILETVGFIKRNAEFLDIYSVTPYIFLADSPFARKVSEFGLKSDIARMPSQERLRLRPFDEVNGLPWKEKLEQRYRSYNTVLKTIIDTYSMAPVEMTHLHLLMYLYHTLGHSNKETIRRVMNIMRCNWKPFYADCFSTMPKFERHLKSKKAFLRE